MTKKRREACILLLDDCFDSASSHAKIVALGFESERFTKHFPHRENPERRQEHIKDPAVISLCHEHGFLLFTTDREMKKTHLERLKRADIGVIATANNSEGTDVWIKALGSAKTQILRDFKKRKRPYFSVLQKSGKLTTDEIPCDRVSRRNRTREADNEAEHISRDF